jgi:CheY-like chemotaxis protein
MTQRTPDVILLDLHMQGVDGVEVCRYIRRDPRFMHVPVLAISSDTQEALIARIRAAGANGFLAKPIELEALEKALAQLETPLTPPRPGGTGPVAGSSSVRS